MAMRVTISNDEPGFSDARVAFQTKQLGKVVLHGGESVQLILEPNKENQIQVQALRREGESA